MSVEAAARSSFVQREQLLRECERTLRSTQLQISRLQQENGVLSQKLKQAQADFREQEEATEHVARERDEWIAECDQLRDKVEEWRRLHVDAQQKLQATEKDRDAWHAEYDALYEQFSQRQSALQQAGFAPQAVPMRIE